mgnify:CR=1 FL=1
MIAEVIVDISHDKVDRPFDYQIPQELEDRIRCGSQVLIPFGKGGRKIHGFVIKVKKQSDYDSTKLKTIDSLVPGSTSLEENMIELAWFIKTNYGSTMNKALRIVLPVKKESAPVVEKYITAAAEPRRIREALERYAADKRTSARMRLLQEIERETILPYEIVKDKLNISPSTLKALEKEGLIRIDRKENLRDAVRFGEKAPYTIRLNPQQQQIADDMGIELEKK